MAIFFQKSLRRYTTSEHGPCVAFDVIGKAYFSLFTVEDEITLQKQHYSAEVCILSGGKDT